MQQKFYSPRAIWALLFGWHGEQIFVKLRPMIAIMLVYAALVSCGEYLIYDYFEILDNFPELGQFHLLFNFVLSILVGFRLNTTYSRWWEARGLWGQLTNHSRNLALRLDCYLGLKNYPQLVTYIAEFPTLLKHHLRGDSEASIQLVTQVGINNAHDCHLPSLWIHALNQEIQHLRDHGKLSLEQYLVIANNLGAYADIYGGCEKILNTPPPLAINTLIKQALLFYMLVFPFGWAGTFGVFVLPMIIVMIYVLWGLEAIADELEEPFGVEENDLPLDSICVNIAKNIQQIAALASPNGGLVS